MGRPSQAPNRLRKPLTWAVTRGFAALASPDVSPVSKASVEASASGASGASGASEAASSPCSGAAGSSLPLPRPLPRPLSRPRSRVSALPTRTYRIAARTAAANASPRSAYTVNWSNDAPAGASSTVSPGFAKSRAAATAAVMTRVPRSPPECLTSVTSAPETSGVACIPASSEDAGMHATPEVSGADVTEVRHSGGDLGTRVMTAAVAAARDLAKPGDTVLLAPAGASFDQFTGYADRGDAFAAAVRAAIR